MARRTTQIYSIFGQIEAVIGEQMAAEGKLRRIELDMIPPTARFDEQGRQARFAVVMSDEYQEEWHRRVKDLRV